MDLVKKPAACCLLHAGFLFDLLLSSEVDAVCFSKMLVDFTGLHGVTSQKL
jgi:hypothetical protein